MGTMAFFLLGAFTGIGSFMAGVSFNRFIEAQKLRIALRTFNELGKKLKQEESENDGTT